MTNDNRSPAELIADIVKAQRKLAVEALARGDETALAKWSELAALYTAKLNEMGHGHLLEDDDAQRT